MKTPLAICGFAAALIVGIAAGGAASGSDEPTTATAAPAPTPTTTTVTKTVTEQAAAQTPQACLDALAAAEKIGRDAAHFTKATLPYPRLVLKAAKAGMNLDVTAIREVTTTVQGMNARMEAVNRSLTSHVDSYKAAAADCRGGGA